MLCNSGTPDPASTKASLARKTDMGAQPATPIRWAWKRSAKSAAMLTRPLSSLSTSTCTIRLAYDIIRTLLNFMILPTTICPWFDVDQQTALRSLRREAQSLALREWTITALRLWRRNMDRRMIGLFLHGTRTHAPQPSAAGVRGHAGCMQGPVCQFVQSCSIRTAHSSISIAPGDPRFKPSCDI